MTDIESINTGDDKPIPKKPKKSRIEFQDSSSMVNDIEPLFLPQIFALPINWDSTEKEQK